MIRRHPHVFGDASIRDAAHQTVAWEEHKAAERKTNENGDGSALGGVPAGFPALTRAQKIQKRASRVGFDWGDPQPALSKVEEETKELRAELNGAPAAARVEEEIGDLLFAVVNVARLADIDAESALRHATAKFERRFRDVEAALAAKGKRPETSTLAEMDALWAEVKGGEKRAPRRG
jgi:MazG family protein